MDREKRKKQFFDLFNLFERKRSYKDFVDSYVQSRRQLLSTLQSDDSLSQNNRYLAQETSGYLNESNKLLRNGNIDSALFFAVQAERRLFSLLLDTRNFQKISDLKKEWYRSYLRDHINSVPKGDRTEFSRLAKKENLTDDEWRKIVNRSTKLRLENLIGHFEKEMVFDKVILHLAWFSTICIFLIFLIIWFGSEIDFLGFTQSATPNVTNGTTAVNETAIANGTENTTGAGNNTNENTPDRGTARSSYILILAAGGLGASVSGLLSKRETDLKKELDAKELEYWMAISRVVLGAASALIVAALVTSNFINISPNGDGTFPVLFAVAIAAGFSDQLLTSALQRVSIADQDADTPEVETSTDSTLSDELDTPNDPVSTERKLTRQIEAFTGVRESYEGIGDTPTEEDDNGNGETSEDDNGGDDGNGDNDEESDARSSLDCNNTEENNDLLEKLILPSSNNDESMDRESIDLNDLYVDEREVDRRELAKSLSPFVGIDRSSGEMRPRDEFFDLGRKKQIIVRLLYRQAAVHLGELNRDRVGEKPKSIADFLDEGKNRIKEDIQSFDFIEHDSSLGGYYIPAHRVDEAIDELPLQNSQE